MLQRNDEGTLIQLKSDQVTTENRIRELEQLIPDLRTRREAVWNAFWQRTISSQEYRVQYGDLERQRLASLAEVEQLQQRLESIRFEIMVSYPAEGANA